MTAYAPPPTFAVQDQQLVLAGQLTQAAATSQAARIKAGLDSLEAAIAAMPEGDAKRSLSFRALRLHNELARGGRLLNDHFQTAQVSPGSAGGDKDPNES